MIDRRCQHCHLPIRFYRDIGWIHVATLWKRCRNSTLHTQAEPVRALRGAGKK